MNGITEWVSKGQPQILVRPFSALGGDRPWEEDDSRLRIPISTDHKSLVKFEKNNREAYINVRQTLQRFVGSSECVVQRRLRQDAIEGKRASRLTAYVYSTCKQLENVNAGFASFTGHRSRRLTSLISTPAPIILPSRDRGNPIGNGPLQKL